jgi:hypothetical protein
MKLFSMRGSKKGPLRSGRLDWLLYLPGAIILSYGLWLTLTTPVTGS